MDKDKIITFQSITPIFSFGIIKKEFNIEGEYKDAKYSISLRRYASGPEGYKEIIKGLDPKLHPRLVSIHIPPNGMATHSTDNFLRIDVSLPYVKELEPAGNTQDTVHIQYCILTALRLHSSRGLKYRYTYNTRYPSNPHTGPGISTGSSLMPQYIFPHLGLGVSCLSETEYANCIQSFNILLNSKEPSTSYDKIIELALGYHMVTFNLEKIEHSYLILMIMFESMFKRVEERNAENASIRISKFLAQDEAEMISINDEFYKEKKQDSFCKIRNAIAHGDPSFDIEIIKAKYPILYSYVTKAIITLLHMPDTDFDKSKDYYDELDKYLNNK